MSYWTDLLQQQRNWIDLLQLRGRIKPGPWIRCRQEFSEEYIESFTKGYWLHLTMYDEPVPPGSYCQVREGLPDGFRLHDAVTDLPDDRTMSYWYVDVYGFEIEDDENIFTEHDEAVGWAWSYRDRWMADNGRAGE